MFALSVFMLIELWPAYYALSHEPELIARWPLDENSGSLVHDVILDNDGKHVGGPEWVKAKFENGLQFNKKTGQYVEIPEAPELAPTDSLTVMAWVNVNPAAGRQEIFCYADSTSRCVSRRLHTTSLLITVFLTAEDCLSPF